MEEHMVEQTLRETMGPIFFAMLSLFDKDAERESVEMLRNALDCGGVTDPIAKDVLRAIIGASEYASA
jgi:hypothetical protein